MSELWLILAGSAWGLALLSGLFGCAVTVGRLLLALGCAAVLVVCVVSLPVGTAPIDFSFAVGGHSVIFSLAPAALWLMGFGCAAALPVCLLGTPLPGRRGWLAGVALSLLGALGVFGMQDGIAFLVAWEIMSLGGAVMLLGEQAENPDGKPILLMLGLLEAGSVALLCAFLLLHGKDGYDFAAFNVQVLASSTGVQTLIGVLLLIGFGAKLGLLPFYEWFPTAYSSGSGASGALLSGVILNAAFFGLGRGLTEWFAGSPVIGYLGALLIIVGIISAVLTILFAFQEDDWRELLSFSSAENASVAVTALGASLLFLSDKLPDLAALAWIVSLLHLAGHSLAKAALFTTADGVYAVTGSYGLNQRGILRRSSWLLGGGAVFAAMSLAAMPPQAGFVSEWYMFQTVFQGFHLDTMSGRLILALAGAGLALTAAIALATFIKLIGIGLQGSGDQDMPGIPRRIGAAVGLLGAGVLALAVGMPWWLGALTDVVTSTSGIPATVAMRDGWVLVPLTATFAFISPTMLVIACPLLALIPLTMFWLARRRAPVRRSAVWYGGLPRDSTRVATTALTFANAMRTFYSFIYRPVLDVTHENMSEGYFLRRLQLSHRVELLFKPLLFDPLVRFTGVLASRLRRLQSGHLNDYLAIIGILLVLILIVAII